MSNAKCLHWEILPDSHTNRCYLWCRSFKGYEQVRVPAIKSGTPAADEKLVLIEEMEDWAQLAFQGYK